MSVRALSTVPDDYLDKGEVQRKKMSLPRQTREAAERLFDTIAPHLEYSRIKFTASKLRTMKVNSNYSTVVRQVDRVFRQEKHSSWIKFVLADFLAGQDLEDPSTPIVPATTSNDKKSDFRHLESHTSLTLFNCRSTIVHNLMDHPTFVPVVNRKNFEENVELLMKARDANILTNQYPLFFSPGTSRKIRSILKGTVPEASSVISDEEITEYKLKSNDEKRFEAEKIANFLADRLPELAHSKIYKFLEKVVDDKTRRVFFLKNVKSACSFHSHLVLNELAAFLLVKMPRFSDETFLAELWRDWNAVRDEISLIFLDSQHRFVQLFEKVEAGMVNNAVNGETTFEVMSQELSELRKLADSRLPERQNKVSAGRVPNVVQVNFNALLLSEQFVDEIDYKYRPKTSRRIFLTNLPIDVDEEELMDVYGRCGEITGVSIFNRRLDLDPLRNPGKKTGRRSTSTKGNMMEKISSTPVYAIVNFSNDEGYKAATDLSLKIFGMVLRRHEVRTTLQKDMKSLYIENIKGFCALDLGKSSLLQVVKKFTFTFKALFVTPLIFTRIQTM